MKIHPLRAEVFHSDGRRNRHDEASSHFSQFRESAQKIHTHTHTHTHTDTHTIASVILF